MLNCTLANIIFGTDLRVPNGMVKFKAILMPCQGMVADREARTVRRAVYVLWVSNRGRKVDSDCRLVNLDTVVAGDDLVNCEAESQPRPFTKYLSK